MFEYRIEDCKIISITNLKKWNCLKPNFRNSSVLTWSNRYNEVTSRMGLIVDTTTEHPYIELDYSWSGRDVKYKIDLIRQPSNLKKGSTYFLMRCQKTGLLCRKVYLQNGRFLHRTAYATLYEAQAEGKKERSLRGVYARLFASEHAYDEIFTKGFTKFFLGKPTRRYKKLLKEIGN